VTKLKKQEFVKPVILIQLFGATMFAAVSIAYLLGLPTDTVYHGELAFRIAIGTLGSVFFVGSIIMLLAGFAKK
jgi:hypothetical protein